jgi:hypothetical protein
VNDLNRHAATQTSNAEPREVSGVLETLAAGISLVVSRPYLFILPLLVDLWTWLGVQIYPTALIEPLQEVMVEQGGRNGPAAAEELGRLGERLRINDTIATLTPSIFSGLPSDSFLNSLIGLLVSPLAEGVDRSTMYSSWGDGLGTQFDPAHWYNVLAIGLLLFAVATILLALFKAPLAHAVRGGETSIGSLVHDVLFGWFRIMGLVAIVVAGMLVIGIPLLALAVVVALFGINFVALVSLALFVFGSIGALYTYFLLDAMFIYRVGPIRAAKMSYVVARFNFAQSWRFAGASLLIATGVLHVWSVLVENPPGIVVALIANAVLGTGLSIASMMFFHDRARLPRPTFNARSFRPARPF